MKRNASISFVFIVCGEMRERFKETLDFLIYISNDFPIFQTFINLFFLSAVKSVLDFTIKYKY